MLAAFPAVGAWDADELIGFARAVTDECFRAYVEDAIVSPGRRRQGVATMLVERLLILLDEIAVVSVFCDPQAIPLYERAGFRLTHQTVLHKSRGTSA